MATYQNIIPSIPSENNLNQSVAFNGAIAVSVQRSNQGTHITIYPRAWSVQLTDAEVSEVNAMLSYFKLWSTYQFLMQCFSPDVNTGSAHRVYQLSGEMPGTTLSFSHYQLNMSDTLY